MIAIAIQTNPLDHIPLGDVYRVREGQLIIKSPMLIQGELRIEGSLRLE